MEALSPADLATVIGHCEKLGMLFGWSLVENVIQILNTTGTGNSTHNWLSLVHKMSQVRNSTSLLGYYICDD